MLRSFGSSEEQDPGACPTGALCPLGAVGGLCPWGLQALCLQILSMPTRCQAGAASTRSSSAPRRSVAAASTSTPPCCACPAPCLPPRNVSLKQMGGLCLETRESPARCLAEGLLLPCSSTPVRWCWRRRESLEVSGTALPAATPLPRGLAGGGSDTAAPQGNPSAGTPGWRGLEPGQQPQGHARLPAAGGVCTASAPLPCAQGERWPCPCLGGRRE